MEKKLGVLGFIVGLIGLIFAIVSYLETAKKKEISYNVLQPSYRIFDNEALDDESNLLILTKDSMKVNQNVYLTTISIWNSGDLTINKSDVRKKISVKLNGITKVIDSKLIKEVDAGISKFTYEVKNDGIFNFNWKFFDPNNGIKLQILYLGEEKLSAKMDGNVLETTFDEFIPAEKEDGGLKKESLFNKFYRPVLLLLLVFTFFASLLLRREIIKKGNKSKHWSFWYFFVFINPIIGLLLLAYFVYFMFFQVYEVPF